MSARLVVIGGPNEGQVFPLADGATVVIGRGETANVRVSDPAASRVHCVLTCSGGTATLKDQGSKTGTRVNGKVITECRLAPEEIIQVGSTKLRFQRVAPPRPKPAPASDQPMDIEELSKLSGTKLGHFTIGESVGHGNTGMVFRAHDTKEDREVALKVYVPEFAKNDEDLHRFIRAVKTMLPMRHQNLVTIYGGGKTGPHCWMAMDFVEGENLTETIARIGKAGKIDWRPALRMAMDVCRGLFYIHGENIVHRSLSPAKVLFSKFGTTKLASLITAKALTGELAQNVTAAGHLLSDVRFLSPEQVTEAKDIDCRCDIYSLGALVYALLTGRAPFDETSVVMTASAIVQKPPRPPRELQPEIPAGLEKLVLQMLAKKPEDRFESAGELLAELEQLPRH